MLSNSLVGATSLAGEPGTLRKVAESYNTSTGAVGRTNTDYALQAVTVTAIEEHDRRRLGVDLVAGATQLAHLNPVQMPASITPALSDELLVGSRTFEVLKVGRIRWLGVDEMYELQLVER